MAFDPDVPSATSPGLGDLTALAENFSRIMKHVLGDILISGVIETYNWDATNGRYSGVTLSGGATGSAAYTYNADGTIASVAWTGGSFGTDTLTIAYTYSSGRLATITKTIS